MNYLWRENGFIKYFNIIHKYAASLTKQRKHFVWNNYARFMGDSENVKNVIYTSDKRDIQFNL